jgi:hypothetical protein
MTADKPTSQADLEWERRTLCSDESCIGVIGPDGRCKECGKPYEGVLPDGGQVAPAPSEAAEIPDATADTVDTGDDPEKDSDPAEDDGATTDSEWEERTLCRDESCIGVIGPDGRCKECGRPYEPER